MAGRALVERNPKSSVAARWCQRVKLSLLGTGECSMRPHPAHSPAVPAPSTSDTSRSAANQSSQSWPGAKSRCSFAVGNDLRTSCLVCGSATHQASAGPLRVTLVLTGMRHATAVTVSNIVSGHRLRQIPVGPLLQHSAARADTGFVRGFTSDNVWAEYLFCPFAQCESAWVDRWAQADAAPSSQERSDERPSDTPGF